MPHTTTRRRVSRAFWGARMAGEALNRARRNDPVRLRPAGWVAAVRPEGFVSEMSARVVEITDVSIRLILPVELRRGTGLSIVIVHPELLETLHVSALIAEVTPPPPVGTTWVVYADFIDMPRADALKIARWSMTR